MYIQRPRNSRVILFALIFIQLIIIAVYFIFYMAKVKHSLEKIVFVQNEYISRKPERPALLTLNDTVNLKRVASRGYFLDFNSSLCFAEGTDVQSMRTAKGVNWQCKCLPGWHGPDCGYPEVLFRALLAKKQPSKLKPVPYQRRLIYIFEYDQCSDFLVDIRIFALGDIIDLFVIHEEDSYLEPLLKHKYFKFQRKILYVPHSTKHNIWMLIKARLKNLRDDDFVISSLANEVPDRSSLIFLKFYGNIPEPLYFRLKWVVFGFFWVHPNRTVISGGICTVAFIRAVLSNDLRLLTTNKTLSTLGQKGIVLGDLNRTGGFLCEYCSTPENIINYFKSNSSKNVINWKDIGTTKITDKFVENLIENGIYIDGKTELKRGHRYSDVDFAPPYVLENDFNFDFLLTNFYAQNDY